MRETNKKGKGGKCSNIPGIVDIKLLKYWSQCKFGGVDSVLIALHRDGVVQRTERLDTAKLEQFFPDITRKCMKMVTSTLQWVRDAMLKLPEYKMYRLAFAKSVNGRKNTKIELRQLSSEPTESKIGKWLNGENKSDLLCHGLVMDSNSGQIVVDAI